MFATVFLFSLLHGLVLYPRMASDELDEATQERMRQREEYLSCQMTRLLQELEQSSQETSGTAWGALLGAAFQQWQFWAVAGVLILLFGLCCWLRQRRSSSSSESSSCDSSGSCLMPASTLEEKEESEEEALEPNLRDLAAIKARRIQLPRAHYVRHQMTCGRSYKKSSCHFPGSCLTPAAASEQDKEESEDKDGDSSLRDLVYARHIQWPGQMLANSSLVVKMLVGNLLCVCQERLSYGFLLVLQPAIEVGSAFEGWSPRVEEAAYCLLVPLKPPQGHTFHLELGTMGETPAKGSCIRVELECTCGQEQQRCNKMLCFVHHPEAKLRRTQGSRILSTLCTGSYLDTQKTARWFQKLLRSAWAAVPQWHHYKMKMLPSSRSCKLLLTNASTGTHLMVEMLFGVQQGDSDIFLTSQASETVCTPSTTWPESYAVAEAKFFRHVARQAQRGTFHLECLHLCTRLVPGTLLSTYTLKTVVMHLLSTTPLAGWRRSDFFPRLKDIMHYLHCCLEEKRLHHFFFGNQNVPEEISLPPAFRTAEPRNLFQHLAQDPAAHAEALRDFEELQDRLIMQLFCGQ